MVVVVSVGGRGVFGGIGVGVFCDPEVFDLDDVGPLSPPQARADNSKINKLNLNIGVLHWRVNSQQGGFRSQACDVLLSPNRDLAAAI